MLSLHQCNLQAAIDRMGVRITELLASSQTAGEQGNVDAAQAAATQADIVKVPHEHHYHLVGANWSSASCSHCYEHTCLLRISCPQATASQVPISESHICLQLTHPMHLAVVLQLVI